MQLSQNWLKNLNLYALNLLTGGKYEQALRQLYICRSINISFPCRRKTGWSKLLKTLLVTMELLAI